LFSHVAVTSLLVAGSGPLPAHSMRASNGSAQLLGARMHRYDDPNTAISTFGGSMVQVIQFPSHCEIPQKLTAGLPLVQSEYLVDGQLRTWVGPMQEVHSPVCVQEDGRLEPVKLGAFPKMDGQAALECLESASRAFDSGRGIWPTMSVQDRITRVERFAFQMAAVRDRVILLLMWEIGKTQSDSVKEFDRTLEYIRDTIAALKDLDRNSSRFTMEQDIMAQIRRAPLGAVLCMGPFNYPLNETFTTLIPALIMGNTVVLKPPKRGILLFSELLKPFQECFPKGVVNTVYGNGPEVVGPMMKSGLVNVLAFIGTSRVADLLKKQHPASHRLRCVLGLDAKNPAVVLPDADLGKAVEECLLGALSFNGQRCTAIKIIFVHRSIAEVFCVELGRAVNALAPGVPWDKDVRLTPLPEPGKPEFLATLVQDAQASGAQVVNEGGGSVTGTYFAPAVVYPVNSIMRLWREEQFGPVLPVVPFDDIEEPIRYITESTFGQQVALFGRDSDQLAHLVDPLVNQVCRVNINSQCQRGPDVFPFTGRKDSAEGTLSVSDALRAFSIRTLVAAKETDDNRRIFNEILRERKSNFLSTDFIF
jgi:glyceraldehyde-3-phosphate dehydrogenase (NADP+)